MSLGFLTESTLLPSKSKKIEVGSRSILDLKAVVYEKEEQGKRARQEGSLRQGRGKQAQAPTKDGLFTRQNKGVHERGAKDEEEIEADKKKRDVARSLQRKAELYEKLKSGEIKDPNKHGFLVDFSAKQRAAEDQGDAGSGSEVEIEDDLGRTRKVPKHSQAHWDYLEGKQRQEVRRGRASSEDEGDEHYSGAQTHFPVSSGYDRDECGEWMEKEPTGKGMEDFDPGPEDKAPVHGLAKARWEVTLNAQEKEFLKEISQKTREKRSEVGKEKKKDAKSERRELLRQRAEAKKRKRA